MTGKLVTVAVILIVIVAILSVAAPTVTAVVGQFSKLLAF